MFKRIATILLSAAILLIMSACGSVSDITGTDEEEKVYDTKNTVNLAMTNVKTLNPVVSSDEDTYQISRLIYQSLFILDDSLKPVGDLAESYKVSKNNRSVLITLDSSAEFSDGERVTSEDVVFSIKAYKEAGKKSEYYGNVRNITDVDNEGKYKVRITFKKNGGGIAKLTFPVLPSHREDISELQKSKKTFKPVGSGLYKVSKYTADEKLVLKPNGKKAANTITFKVYPDKAKVLNLMSGNIVSFLVRTDSDRHSDIGCTDLRNDEFPSNKLIFAGFNTRRSAVSSSSIRKALCYSFDRESLLKKQYYSCGVITDTIFYPGYLGIDAGEYKIEYSFKKTKELLLEAGWKDINKDGYLENVKKKTVTLTIAVSESRRKVAESIAEGLAKADVECRVISYPRKKFIAALKKGKYDIFIGEMTFADYYDLTGMIGGSSDFAGCSSKLVKAAENANRCLDEEAMKEYTERLIEQLDEEMVYYPIFYTTYSYVLSDELQGEVNPLFNNIYSGCDQWSSSYLIENDEEEEKAK